MYTNLSTDRKLIKQYFECLKKRNTTTESFAKQVISDFLAHWKEKRAPKEGVFVYIVVGGLLFSLAINISFTVALVVATFLIAKTRMSPNITPRVSDEQIDRWLLDDKKALFKKSPTELDVIVVNKDENLPKTLNVVMNLDHPIELSSGFILEDNDTLLRALIGSQDYYVEKGLDGNTRYSIHIFMVIFLCKNFLSYYKCHWNFIRGVATLVDTGEYLYDTIVSVNTQELSSANLGNEEGKKLILKKNLRISTADGKEIEFPAISEIRMSYESTSENEIPEVKDAAHIIRAILRERRIDMQIVKSFDADD
jgi:hypothetical protein